MRYRCIVADPPWAYGDKALPRGASTAAAADHYTTMPTAAICGLACPADDDAHLYLWTTNSHLVSGDAQRVCESWGFTPKTIVTWVKSGNIGLGNYFRNTTEHAIFATRGSLPVLAHNFPTHFTAPRGAHSQKPDALLNIAEQMSPGPRLEMFARRRRDGWDVFGDQAPQEAQMVVGL